MAATQWSCLIGLVAACGQEGRADCMTFAVSIWIHLFVPTNAQHIQYATASIAPPRIKLFAPFYSPHRFEIFTFVERHTTPPSFCIDNTTVEKSIFGWLCSVAAVTGPAAVAYQQQICPPNYFRHEFHNATPVCCAKIVASPILTYLNNNLRPILWSRLSLNLLQITIRIRYVCTEWKNKRSPSWLYTLLERVFAFKLRFISTGYYGPWWMRSMHDWVRMGGSRCR